MAASDYDPLRKAAADAKTAEKKHLEEEAKRHAEAEKKNADRKQELQRRNADGYPELEATHRRVGQQLQDQSGGREKAEVAKSEVAQNYHETVKALYGAAAAAKAKPAQVERPIPAPPPTPERQPGRNAGQMEFTPSGTHYRPRDEYVARRREAAPAKGEMTEKRAARAGAEASKEMTEGRARRIAKVTMTEGLRESLRKTSERGSGGRGAAD